MCYFLGAIPCAGFATHMLGAIAINMGVSNNRGRPPKWWFIFMENPIHPRMTLGGKKTIIFRFNIQKRTKQLPPSPSCLSWEEEELDIELLNDAGIQAAKARSLVVLEDSYDVVFFFVQVTYILPLVFGMLWGIVF